VPRFLVDAQLPPALARKLTALGHKAIHVLDVDLLEVTAKGTKGKTWYLNATLSAYAPWGCRSTRTR